MDFLRGQAQLNHQGTGKHNLLVSVEAVRPAAFVITKGSNLHELRDKKTLLSSKVYFLVLEGV